MCMARPLQTVTDTAVYPVMITNYAAHISGALGDDGTTRQVFSFTLICGLTLLNFFGLKLVGWTSIILVGMCLLPFVFFIGLGIPHIETDNWFKTKPSEEINWGMYMNTLFWNLNYFDAASTLAGEVENPSKTFPKALAWVQSLTD